MLFCQMRTSRVICWQGQGDMGGCFARGSRPASPTRIWARLVLCRRRLSRCHGAHGTLRGIGPGIDPRAHQRRPASRTSDPAAAWGHWAWPSLADPVGPRPQGHRKDARGWEPPRKRPFAENRGAGGIAPRPWAHGAAAYPRKSQAGSESRCNFRNIAFSSPRCRCRATS